MIRKYFNYEEIVETAQCHHCSNIFTWEEETCEVYEEKFLCSDCYDKYYGYCNECGELNLYSDMNDDIICKGCER